jgi:hypothetical protein
MKDRPILMSGPMVRAWLAGRKNQTRRECTHPLLKDLSHIVDLGDGWWGDEEGDVQVRCPYGKPGDRLWVKETFARIDGQTRPWIETDYRATYTHGDRLGDTLGIKKRWTPSIFMPRHASRITLEVTRVRVERLHDISVQDAEAEGIERDGVAWRHYTQPVRFTCTDPRMSYQTLWESINGPESWAANPWVWVVVFK